MSVTGEYFVAIDDLELEKYYWNKFNYEKDKGNKLHATTPTTHTTTSIHSTTTTPTHPTPTPTPITTSTTSPTSTSTSSTPATIETTNPIPSGTSNPTKFLTTNVDPIDITPRMVEVIQFIKYTKMSLKCEDDVLQFYQNFYAQAMRCNIILTCGDVKKDG